MSAGRAGTDLPANWQSIASIFIIRVLLMRLGSLCIGMPCCVMPAILLSLARLEQASRNAAFLGTILA
jgi:hypothetical protein